MTGKARARADRRPFGRLLIALSVLLGTVFLLLLWFGEPAKRAEEVSSYERIRAFLMQTDWFGGAFWLYFVPGTIALVAVLCVVAVALDQHEERRKKK